MPYVLTADQIGSRTRGDMLEATLAGLARYPTRLGFTRTVGDEFQGLLEDPLSVVGVTLDLMRDGGWHIGVGVGQVQHPLPVDVRSARGPAFLAARAAVETSKRSSSHICVQSRPPANLAARDAEVVIRLVGGLRERRTPEGWEAVDLMAHGATQAEAAQRLGISQQAVSQRLRAAQWPLEHDAIPVLARLLERTDWLASRDAAAADDAERR